MNPSLPASLFLAIAAALCCRADERADFFEKRVRPIFHDHCVECHNAEKEKFNLGARKERLPWIWQTPKKQTIPEVPGSTDVDRFLSAKLPEKGLSPAAPTEDLTWLRRVYFAVTGLPPQREQMQASLKDTSPQRRERVVDEVLASQHFGERWARHWMDVVRYAESRDHEDDFIVANAMLHLLGMDHTKLTYRFGGRDLRLTDVHGNVVREILA